MSDDEVLATGRFRVDRRRALDQLARHQLADPAAYAAELVAAGVCAGATSVAVSQAGRELLFTWNGDPPTRAELDAIFDHLFGDPDSPRGHMLQHLAVGLLGALARLPRYIEVECGGDTPLRLSLKDPASTLCVEEGHGVEGVRVRVGLSAFALPTVEAPEILHVREACAWSRPFARPRNGRLLDRDGLDGLAEWLGPHGEIVLLAHEGPPVVVVRHGVTVATLERTAGSLRVSGWWDGDALRLDASRSKPLLDDAWARAGADIDDATAALLRKFGAARWAAAVAVWHRHDGLARRRNCPRSRLWEQDRTRAHEELSSAAAWLASHGKPLGVYATMPILVDVFRQEWTPEQVNRFPGPKGTLGPLTRASDDTRPIQRLVLDDPTLAAAAAGCLVFSATDSAVLAAVCPGLTDIRERLFARAVGARRRRPVGRLWSPTTFPSGVNQRRFRAGRLRGAVAFADAGGDRLSVRLQIGGVYVCTVERSSPAGPMEAILDHPWFETDDLFSAVVTDLTRQQAEATLWDEAIAFAAQQVHRRALGSKLPPAGIDIVSAAIRACGDPALLAPILRDAPALCRGDGRFVPLSAVVGRAWRLAAEADGDPNVLVIPVHLQAAWAAWLTATTER